MGDKGKGRRGKEQGRGGKDICPGGTRDCLWLEETDVVYMEMAVYKGKRGNLTLG